MRLPFLFKLVFNRFFFEKIFALVLLGILLYALDSFLFIFLVTFLFAYLFLDLAKAISAKIEQLARHVRHPGIRGLLVKTNRLPVIITAVYLGFVVIVTAMFYNLIPHLINETGQLVKEVPDIVSQLQHGVSYFQSSVNFDLGIDEAFAKFINNGSIENTAKNLFENIKNIGIFLVQIVIALVLSFVFIIDREKILSYFSLIKTGNFSFLHYQFASIGEKVSKGFGLIFKAQSIIAFANAVLTTIGLLLISFIHGGEAFPFLATISVVVFIMGFIPVLGFFISAFPILLIGFNYGGVNVIAEICVMVAIVHAVEAYYLNPKIVSSYMEFPVFITFLILLVSEHLFGFVGLLIGVPLFYILLEFFKDLDRYVTKIKRVSQTIDTAKTTTKEAITKDIRLSRSGKRGV